MATVDLLATGQAESHGSAILAPFAAPPAPLASEWIVNDAPVALHAAIAAPAQSTLSTALVSGTAYTSLSIVALTVAVNSGDLIQVSSGSTTQTFIASAAAAVGATSIAVVSLVANFSYPVGSVVFDRTESVTVTRASASTGWPGDSNGPPSANFRLNVSVPGSTSQVPELVLVTGGQGTTTLTVTRAVEPIQGQQVAQAFGTNAVMTPTITAASPSLRQIVSYDETVLTKLSLAPVAYWKLNDPVGSTTAADSSGNGYTLTVSGTVTFGEPSVVPSDSETSVKGDGSTGYLGLATAAKMPVSADPFTLIAACNVPLPLPTSGYPIPASFNMDGSARGSVIGIFTASGSAYLGAWANGDTAPVNSIAVGGVHLLAGVFDGVRMTVVLDGVPLIGYVPAALASAAGYIGVLGTYGGNNYSSFPVGRVAIFAGVLTPKDWALLMQAFTGV